MAPAKYLCFVRLSRSSSLSFSSVKDIRPAGEFVRSIISGAPAEAGAAGWVNTRAMSRAMSGAMIAVHNSNFNAGAASPLGKQVAEAQDFGQRHQHLAVLIVEKIAKLSFCVLRIFRGLRLSGVPVCGRGVVNLIGRLLRDMSLVCGQTALGRGPCFSVKRG